VARWPSPGRGSAARCSGRVRARGPRPCAAASGQPDPGPRRLLVGDLERLVHGGTARRAGRELHLTRTEFRLLVDLAAHVGRVVTREELVERVWGYTCFGDTRLLDIHILRLRMKVEDGPLSALS
jgi:two-component system response regulator MtrA